jgi:hypothetical protein
MSAFFFLIVRENRCAWIANTKPNKAPCVSLVREIVSGALPPGPVLLQTGFGFFA